jgi:hypothetical protein
MSVVYAESDFFLDWMRDEFVPMNRSKSGYGSKIPTQYRIKCADNRVRRVYAICYSNAASHYILVSGNRKYIHGYDFPE